MSVESTSADDTRMDLGAIARAVLSRWFRIVVITALALGVTYAILYFVPKMYESSASILVETRDSAFSATGTAASTPGASMTIDSVISSQIELIKSRDTLLPVIDQLNLDTIPEFNGAGVSPVTLILQLIGRKPEVRPIQETVLANLVERLTVIRERDSAIISVVVRSTDPELAAKIANAIAAAHVKRRAELSLEDTTETSQWLEAEIVKLRERVNEAEQAVADFRVDKDLLDGANNTSLVNQQISTLATQISAATERRTTAQSRAALIRGLIEQGQPIDGLSDVQSSVVIQQLSQSKAELQRQLAERSSTLLPNHPTIRALRAQLGEIEDQIRIEGRRVATALEAEAKVEADLVVSLQDELTRLKMSAGDQTMNTVTLAGLEREAKAQRDILESYLLHYRDAVSRTESSATLPDVRVVTAAAPSTTPASPKTALTMGAVAFIALALQVGGIIFGELLSGRALTPVRAGPEEVEVEETAEPAPAARAERVEAVAVVTPVAEVAPEPESEPEVTVPAVAYVPPAPVVEPRPAEMIAPIALAETAAAPVAEPPPSEPDVGAVSGDIALGRVRVVIVAAIGSSRDVSPVVDALVDDAIRNGMSVAYVDAGSGRPSMKPGLTDLAVGRGSFGDVVHKDLGPNRAEVPWGTIATLDRRSDKPRVLIDALSDIYEVVVVSAGRIGMASALPVFAGADCRLLLVAGPRIDPEMINAALGDAQALGFGAPELVAAVQRAEVA